MTTKERKTMIADMIELAIDEGWSDYDFYQEAYDRGFTPEDFNDPEHVRQQMGSYGII